MFQIWDTWWYLSMATSRRNWTTVLGNYQIKIQYLDNISKITNSGRNNLIVTECIMLISYYTQSNLVWGLYFPIKWEVYFAHQPLTHRGSFQSRLYEGRQKCELPVEYCFLAAQAKGQNPTFSTCPLLPLPRVHAIGLRRSPICKHPHTLSYKKSLR